MINAPYETSSSGGYIDQLAEHIANGVDSIMRGMTASPPVPATSHTIDLEPWIYVDPAIQGQMSMFQCRQDGSIGVFYLEYAVPEKDLRSWRQQIQANHGDEVVNRLIGLFREIPSANEQDAWLNSTVVSAYMAGLQSNKRQVLDPGYYQRSDFLSSLPSRLEWVKKLKSANQIFWPICEGAHWYLMIIEKDHNNIYTVKVLDSFNNQGKHAEIAEKGFQLLSKLYASQPYLIAKGESPSYLIPTQDNAVDCGTAICYYASKKAQGQLLSSYYQYHGSLCNYVQFRLHMAKEIAENTLFMRKPPLLQDRKPCFIDLRGDDDKKMHTKRRTIKT